MNEQAGPATPPEQLVESTIILFGHSTCPSVPPLKGMLSRAEANFDYVDIRRDQAAAARVRSINNGYESVPTLVFPDGSTLTEPSPAQLKGKLESMGYRVGFLAWVIGNAFYILMFAAFRLCPEITSCFLRCFDWTKHGVVF